MRSLRARAGPLILGTCFAFVAAATSFFPIAWHWQEGWDLHFLFWARGLRPAPDNVVLVPIDSIAARRLFLPEAFEDFERCREVRLDRPPPGYKNVDPADVLTRWPRCLHARALEALTLAQPDAIVMDISFRPRSDPSGLYTEQDRTLAAAIRKAGRVLLALKIGSGQDADEQAQPIAGEIEPAALALAPFLLMGHQLERTDKFCTFKEDHGWSGPCLPAVAHQVAALKVYPEFRALLERAASKNLDLIPLSADALLADGSIQAPVRLIRLLATDPQTAERVRALLPSDEDPIAPERRRLRSLTDIYLGPAIRYFNFYAPAGHSFQTLRYEALVAEGTAMRPAPGSLRGKVVFIGFAEHRKPEASEHFSTPFTARNIKLSGVELAATAYANLQDGSAIRPASFGSRGRIALTLGIVCTVLGVVLLPQSLIRGSLAIATLGSIYFAFALFMFQRFALWLPISPLGLDLIGGFAAGIVELKRQKAHAYDALRALLPKEVVDKIVNQNQKLAQIRESVFGTCVITDMQRFTALFSGRGSGEVTQILDRYFDALFPVVQREGGYTVDVLGDSMLAVWHDKIPDPARRRQACMAALRLAEAAEHFREPKSDQAFHTRMGVEYGEMTIGMVGSSSHLKYGPVGMPVNAAARLQELCKRLGTRLLVTESVTVELGEFLLRDVGRFTLRDVSQPVHVYELMGERIHAKGEQLELCESFRDALAAYQAPDRHGEARTRFETLRREHPADGPSAYYAGMCAEGCYHGKEPIPAG